MQDYVKQWLNIPCLTLHAYGQKLLPILGLILHKLCIIIHEKTYQHMYTNIHASYDLWWQRYMQNFIASDQSSFEKQLKTVKNVQMMYA